MSVPYYLGAQAIAERLGYKDTKIVIRLATEKGLPIYKRAIPRKCGGFVRCWAISESAMTAWELLQGQRTTQTLRQQREAKLLTAKLTLRA